MSDKSTQGSRLTRREFLKAGTWGFCTMGLTGISACTRERNNQNTPTPQTARKGFIRAIPSPWFTKLENYRVRCELCPRQCELARGERAVCRVRENRDGVGYTLVYGNPLLLQEDPVERKPFFHVMPGSWALSVATVGCNLSCKFCEAWDMALVEPEEVHSYDMLPEKLIAHVQAANVPAISFAFTEPVVYYEYMEAVASLAKEAGLLNLVHTAGYIRPEPLKALVKNLDAVNVDLKSFDPVFYREVVGGELEPVLATLKLLKEAGIHIEITNILIPTLNDDPEGIGRMCQWIARELGTDIPVHFARFYPLYKLSNLPQTPVSTLDRARSIALNEGLKFVYIARVTGHEGENTFCPGCREVVIKRMGFVIDEMHLDKGKCSYCGTEIPGIWA